MAGRKPKPTALKTLEGNPGKRKINTKEPIPGKGIPTCSEWLLQLILRLLYFGYNNELVCNSQDNKLEKIIAKCKFRSIGAHISLQTV